MLSNSKLAAVQEIIEFLAAQAEAVLEEEQEGQGFRSLAVTFILSGAEIGRASCRERVELGGRRVTKKKEGIRDLTVTGVQTCALPICSSGGGSGGRARGSGLPLSGRYLYSLRSGYGYVRPHPDEICTGRGESGCPG